MPNDTLYIPELILASLYDGRWVRAEETESHVTIECTKRVSMR